MTRSASEAVVAVRSDNTGRVKHYLCTDGMRHKSRADAVFHQRGLDWEQHYFGSEEPRTLDEWAARIDQLRAQHGGGALLVVDSGYDGHELSVYSPAREDADPGDVV